MVEIVERKGKDRFTPVSIFYLVLERQGRYPTPIYD